MSQASSAAGAVGPRHRHLVVRARDSGRIVATRSSSTLNAHPRLEPGEARAGADVRTTAERHVGAGVGPIESELVRVVEHRFVTVRRQEAERDLVAGAELLTVQLPRSHAVAQQEADRRVVAQRLLDRDRDQLRIGAQLLVEVGVVRDGPQQVADQVTGGLVPRDEEEHELGARLDVGEAATVDLALQQTGS